eukprot:Nk52_evm120s226 gene=Nk52_evmTU120s226
MTDFEEKEKNLPIPPPPAPPPPPPPPPAISGPPSLCRSSVGVPVVSPNQTCIFRTVDYQFDDVFNPDAYEERYGAMCNELREKESKRTSLCIEDHVEGMWLQGVQPLYQVGPSCGFVAMEMASSLVCAHSVESYKMNVESAFAYARRKEYTNLGELFDVHYLKDILENCYGINSCVYKVNEKSGADVVEHLRDKKKPVIFAYDADKNHSPTKCHGHRAHWCVLFGYFAIGPDQQVFEETCTHSKGERHFSSGKNLTDIAFLGMQGKSKNAGLWWWKELYESSANMNEMDPKKLQMENEMGEAVYKRANTLEKISSMALFIE